MSLTVLKLLSAGVGCGVGGRVGGRVGGSPNRDLHQISHRIIKGLLLCKVMRIENMITQVKFSSYFNRFSLPRL